MNFESFFRFVSYAAVFCGFFSLWISGTFGLVVTAVFVAIFIAAWFLEDTRWQIGEKLGTTLIVLALPVFYGLWYGDVIRPSGGETWVAGLLARMILCLTAIKLLQRKSDRDWIFLYLMAFFEVLLAAGLSISGLYMLAFVGYLLFMVCSIIAFEIRKTARTVENSISGRAADRRTEISESSLVMRIRRVPSVSIALIVFIVLLAVPLFFMLPRVGGAGFGGDQRGMKTSGFSERVQLGQFGRIVEDDRVVMRVKFDDTAAITNNLYFRGVALDTFDNRSWSRSKVDSRLPFPRITRNANTQTQQTGRSPLFTQTIYLEPLDTPILFGLPKIIGIQGNFDVLNIDGYGAISHNRTSERISYKAESDLRVPSSTSLRNDAAPYQVEMGNYRQLPTSFDSKIAEFATELTAKHSNRYDKALAIESYLQTNLGYTLEQKASGSQPLSDFLFNVREGHCEYFATAMAMMLRTQGIATRIVNGYHGGEYNDAVGLTIVRQRHAHAWVEVYFPGENAWITFDPTPFAGQPGGGAAAPGIAATFGKYFEAIEAIWIQYFVAFDDQEQRTLGRSVKTEFQAYQSALSTYLGVTSDLAAEWLAELRGDKGLSASLTAVGYGAGIFLGAILVLFSLIWLLKKIVKLTIWRKWYKRLFFRRDSSAVEFYEKMIAILASKGLSRQAFQTPLEFAYSVDIPEAVSITEKYQQVRFGKRELSRNESAGISEMLSRLESWDRNN